ncbi:MAG: hypothetical protein JJ855_06050 [Rhodospirillales bacterium]|nr:hypothetical protein [Rhodospirillales bacterium]
MPYTLGLNRWWSGFAFTVLVALTASPVSATESIDGHRFLNLCVVTESDYESERRFAACERFVGEVRELLGYHKVHGFAACIPEEVPDIQLVIAGIARLQSRSDQHDREAHATLAEIYAQRWPCNG